MLREMWKNKYKFVFCMLLAISLAGGIFTKAYIGLEGQEEEKKLRVVASFYPVYIAAQNVVGNCEGIELENLSEPQTGCLHDYQLTPQDMILMSKADLFLVNGGGIEGFLEEVGESYPTLDVVKITEGMDLLPESGNGHVHAKEEGRENAPGGDEDGENTPGREDGGKNAHGWMDTRIYAQMVENITGSLSKLDPGHADIYQQNARRYCEKIEALSDQVSEIREHLSGEGTEAPSVVIFHEAYAYVAEEYGLHTAYCLNLDEERQISAREVAEVMEEIEENHAVAVLAEEQYGKSLGDTVEAETDCGVTYLDPLVRGDYSADSYLTAMQENIDKIRRAVNRFGRET